LDKIVGVLLIAILTIVSVTSLTYYILNKSNQTQNIPSPTPTPEPTAAPSEDSTESATIPTPSVPEFTLKLADHSYDVPESTTSTFDPYTGKTVPHTSPSYHVQNLTIDIIFRNQQYPSTIDGNQAVLYYDIAIKPHYTEDWYGPYDKGWFPAQTDSEFTTISFPRIEYPDEAKLDFRAQVYLGYHYDYVDYSHIQPFFGSSFACSASDWSETQTITIP
jgi:hypothetical protein